MKERQLKSVPWSLRVPRDAIARLHEQAAKHGMSAAEYSRRILFSGTWEGMVFADCREIAAKLKPEMPIEASLPYVKSVIERLKQGQVEVQEIRTLILESILPALDQAEAKITAVREMHETSTRQLLGINAMFKEVIKAAMERRAPS
jgi:hypothetical protein